MSDTSSSPNLLEKDDEYPSADVDEEDDGDDDPSADVDEEDKSLDEVTIEAIVEKDWYCLIDSLVILHSHVTCAFVANALYAAFIYAYVSLVCLYMVFIYSYVSCMCSCIAHMLCPLSATRSHMRDSSTCNMVCCHNNNPTSAPIGDPSMARLPWGL